MTYRELNEKANQLAEVLRKKGVGSDIIVGIMVNRSFEMLIGIMGVLKAGGAYLPIDPEYPSDRVSYMLEDSGTGILLTSLMYIDSAEFKGETINLGDETLYIGNGDNSEKVNKPKDLAYVIYTSGSTGKPKGVMIEHKSVINLIKGITNKIDFCEGKTILALTSISSDEFILETLLPLTKGLKVVIASEDQLKDSQLLSEVIIKNQVGMLQVTPSRMQMLMSGTGNVQCLKQLKEIMVGGEAFPAVLLQELKKHTKARILNLYGRTETTVWSAVKDLTEAEKIDIGAPIANTQIYIVDKNYNLKPIGVPGELCITGDGLARGYFNREELTNEKFVTNPFKSGERMYRTGDLARWLSSGNIEYLGRLNFQSEIREYKLELGKNGELADKI
jgi:fengycin family lipopeptide synthetase D